MTRFIPANDEANLLEEWHHTIFGLMEKIDCCPDYELPDNFKILIFALEQIFGKEQLLMEKFDFPAMTDHILILELKATAVQIPSFMVLLLQNPV